jgi:hypothetical protein
LRQKKVELEGIGSDTEKLIKRLETIVNCLQHEVPKSLPEVIDPELQFPINYDTIMKTQVEKILDDIFTYQNGVPDLSLNEATALPNSKIVKKSEHFMLLKKCLGTNKHLTFKLLYSGHKDGYTPQAFHKKCDGKNNTLTIIHSSHNAIFGGFIDKPWNQSEAYLVTENAWLYSLTQKQKYTLKSGNSQYAGYGSASYGPTFGGGNDFYISGDFKTTAGYSNPHSYNWTGYEKLAGGQTFTVKEIEVYQVFFGGKIASEDKKITNLFANIESQIVPKKILKD